MKKPATLFALAALLSVSSITQAQNEREEIIVVQPVTTLSDAPAASTRSKPIHEGATVFERISRHEMTRLQIVGGRIRHINYKPEELEITQDESAGQAFLSPLVDKQINLFVTTNTGVTFTLMLNPEPGLPARTVALRESHTQDGDVTRQGSRIEQRPTPLSMMTYEQAITTLVYVTANNQPLQGVSEQIVNARVPLWQGTEFIHLRNMTAAGMVLSEFRLTNTSKTSMRLVEQELYKPGVLAVAVEQHLLDPGESTPVFVVFGDRK